MEEQTLSHTRDSLNTAVPELDFILYHAQDGKPLANYIQQRFSDKRLQCSVQTKDFDSACKFNTHQTDSNVAKVTVIIVSPMILSVLPHLKLFVKDLFPNPEQSVALCIQIQMEKFADLMKDSVEHFENWTICLIEDNRASFRNCLVTMMTMLEDYDSEPLPTLKLFHILPSTISSKTEKIHVLFTKEIHSQVEVRFCDEVMSTAVYNPYTVAFTPPVQLPSSAVIEITINGVSVGKDTIVCLSKKEEMCQLLHDVINPLEFLAETLFSEKFCAGEDLDRKLADAMEDDIKVKLVDAFRQVQHVKWDDYPTRQEQPTLLHLAAKLGLRKLSGVLLKMPGAIQACCMLNSSGMSAEDIARMSGHSQLAEDIQKFKQLIKDHEHNSGSEPIYMDMKKTVQMVRTWSGPVSPVSPPIPTTPRPRTDPKCETKSASSEVPLDNSLDNVDEEAPVLRRQESKASFSSCRDGKILESRPSKHHQSVRELNRSDRVTLLIEDPLDVIALSAPDFNPDRAEREYATIGEIFEDLKPYLVVSGQKQNTCSSSTDKTSTTSTFVKNNQDSIQKKTFEPYSVCKPEGSIYNIPKPVTGRK